jgi:hypothetical protein
MSHRSFFIITIVLMLSLSGSARSQEPAPAGGSDERAALKKSAIDLLASIAGQVDTLRSPENRARIGSNAAEALWEHDEKRARTLFAAVGEDIRTGFAAADPEPETHKHTILVFWQLRSDTLGRIAKHDPELAIEFLRATRLPEDEQLPYQTSDTEAALELRLAAQAAAKNPDLAVKLGRESLEKGFSSDLLIVLSTLQSKDKAAALGFYQAVIDKLKSADMVEGALASHFALTLAQQFQPPQADERVYRELIGMLLSAVLASGCGKAQSDESPQICYEIRSIYPKFERYYGQRAASLKSWTQDDGDDASPSQRWWEQINELTEKGTVDEILAFVEKNPDSKYQLSDVAVRKAEAAGDYARARQIATDLVGEYSRKALLAQIVDDEKKSLVNPEDPVSVQQMLSTFRTDEQRVEFLVEMAVRISNKNRGAALALIDRVRQIVDSFKPGQRQFAGQIGLAMFYSSLKSRRGFEIMETLMPKMNELVAASAALDGFERNYLSEGEWNMTGEGAVGGLLTALSRNVGYFAWLDFDRSVTLASQLERPELRLMAQLKIAQSALSEPPSLAATFQPRSRVTSREFVE